MDDAAAVVGLTWTLVGRVIAGCEGSACEVLRSLNSDDSFPLDRTLST